ncbi:MAG: sugar porter family MFS transporter [Rhodothermales bacterium]
MKKSNISTKARDGQASSRYIYLVAFIAATGGFLFGYDLSIISGALPFLETHFELSASGKGGAVSSAILGSIAGPLFGLWLSDAVGRRKTLAIASVCFMLSAIGTALPWNLEVFNVWRVIGGIGVGLAAMTSPMYIAEISPAHLRGRLVTVNQLAIVLGINLAVIVSYSLSFGGHWRWMFASEVIPIVLLMVGLRFLPRSPRWLMATGRTTEALDVLTRINGKRQAAIEYTEIHNELANERGSLRELFSKNLRRALLVGVVIMVFSQINGVNMMLLYGPTILVEAKIGTASDAIFFTIFLNLLILVSTVIAFWLVKRFGRRPILIGGVSVMALGHVLMAGVFYLDASPLLNLAAMFIAAGAFTLSLAPLSWIIVSEIFPNRIRGKAVAIVCAILYASSFLCAQFFPMITEAFEAAMGHPGGAYLLFAGICLSCVVFCWRVLPETKDISLETVGDYWAAVQRKRKKSS